MTPMGIANEISPQRHLTDQSHFGCTAIYAHSVPGCFIDETGRSKDIDFVEHGAGVLLKTGIR